jgi:hypothetical protein
VILSPNQREDSKVQAHLWEKSSWFDLKQSFKL